MFTIRRHIDATNLLYSNTKIGSIHNKKVQYDVDECFFAKDDIPLGVREKHQDILKFIDPDFLGMRKKEWNTSVSVPVNPQAEQDHQRKLLNIRIGLENHPIQKLKDKNIEAGCDLRDDYSGWAISTEIDKRQVRRQHEEIDMRSAITCQNYRNKYIGGEYMAPESTVVKLNELLRGEKIVNETDLNELRQIYIHKNPETSKAKMEGAVFKMNYEKKLKERQVDFYDKLKTEELNKNLVSKEILKSNTTGRTLDQTEDYMQEEDYSKKIDNIMRTITEAKKNKPKQQK